MVMGCEQAASGRQFEWKSSEAVEMREDTSNEYECFQDGIGSFVCLDDNLVHYLGRCHFNLAPKTPPQTRPLGIDDMNGRS